MSIDQLTTFFGWMSVIHIGLLLFSTVMLQLLRSTVESIHSKLFGIPKENLPEIYFNYLANYKLLVLVFALGPYTALKLMALGLPGDYRLARYHGVFAQNHKLRKSNSFPYIRLQAISDSFSL